MKVKNPISLLVNHIAKEVSPKKVILYGSRARGDARERSDIDLAVVGSIKPEKWDHLQSWMEENPVTLLPVDLVLLSEASQNLKKNILQQGIVVYEKKRDSAKP